TQTAPIMIIEQVSVIMQSQVDCGLPEDFIIPVLALRSSTSPGIAYISFSQDNPEEYAFGSSQCVLRVISKELDPSTGECKDKGYEDKYQLEDVELAASGYYLIPTTILLTTSHLTFAATYDSIIEILNVEPLGGTEMPTSPSIHILQLSGLVNGSGGKVLVRCQMAHTEGEGVTQELGICGEQERAC
ncbi:coatomer gamma subunit appendage platform subdomain-containing protein, partial [Pisolithus sp. B1]